MKLPVLTLIFASIAIPLRAADDDLPLPVPVPVPVGKGSYATRTPKWRQSPCQRPHRTPAATVTDGKPGPRTFELPVTKARYIRITGTKRITGYGYSLYEIEVYGVR